MSDQINCKIVQDLMPNYIEDLTNEYTNTVMREHLEKCSTCRRTYELLIHTEDKAKSVQSNIKEAKKLKWYMKKVKIINLFLGIIIASITIFVSYAIYQNLFCNVNYAEPTSNIEVTELYTINDNYVYFTIKDNSKYKSGSESIKELVLDDNDIISAITFSRTTIGNKYNEKLTAEEKRIESSKTFVIDKNNNSIIFLDSFIDNNPLATGSEIIDYLNSMRGNKGVYYTTSHLDDVYYVGKNIDDKLLIWQEGMELPQYPY